MFLNSWAIALTLVSLLGCFLVLMAGKTAVRVLRHWDGGSDSNTQIKLEGEIWLSSTLVMYGACFQIISLVLLVFAADHFAGFIAGAMCATGSLLANSYGMPLLYLKLATSFGAGLWIVVHRLDISCEEYPLVRCKYVMLLLLVPLLVADFYLQVQYIRNLTPDIITSCCAVVFDAVQTASTFNSLLQSPLLLFYGGGGGLLLLGLVCLKFDRSVLVFSYGFGLICFLVLGVDTIISTLSSYIYAMPYHNCPFCLIKSEYNFIGFALYFLLFGSVFCGFSSACLQLFSQKNGLKLAVFKSKQLYLTCSITMLVLFTILASYHMVLYRLTDGEW